MKAPFYDRMKVRKLRESAGLSRAALALEMGVSLMTIHRVENGTACSTELLMRIAEHFDIDWRLLLLPGIARPASGSVRTA